MISGRLRIARFNDDGLLQFENLLNLPLNEALEAVRFLITSESLIEELPAEINIRPVESRFSLARILHSEISTNSRIAYMQADIGMWSWLAAAWMPALFENAPAVAKIGERARWILDKQKSKYYRHLLAGPYFIYSHHFPNPELALCILEGSPIVPGELVGQVAATNDIAYSVGAEVATRLYIDSETGKAKSGSRGSGPGSPRRLTAAYLNQIDLTVDYRGMTADEILGILPKEFDRFKDS